MVMMRLDVMSGILMTSGKHMDDAMFNIEHPRVSILSSETLR